MEKLLECYFYASLNWHFHVTCISYTTVNDLVDSFHFFQMLENRFLLVNFPRVRSKKFPFINMYIHKIGKELILIFDQSRVQYK